MTQTEDILAIMCEALNTGFSAEWVVSRSGWKK